jgi:hypothetical protein
MPHVLRNTVHDASLAKRAPYVYGILLDLEGIAVLYVGQTLSGRGALGRLAEHLSEASGATLRERIEAIYNVTEIDGLSVEFAAVPLARQKSFWADEGDYREAVESRVQYQLLNALSDRKIPVCVVSRVRPNAYCQLQYVVARRTGSFRPSSSGSRPSAPRRSFAGLAGKRVERSTPPGSAPHAALFRWPCAHLLRVPPTDWRAEKFPAHVSFRGFPCHNVGRHSRRWPRAATPGIGAGTCRGDGRLGLRLSLFCIAITIVDNVESVIAIHVDKTDKTPGRCPSTATTETSDVGFCPHLTGFCPPSHGPGVGLFDFVATPACVPRRKRESWRSPRARTHPPGKRRTSVR